MFGMERISEMPKPENEFDIAEDNFLSIRPEGTRTWSEYKVCTDEISDKEIRAERMRDIERQNTEIEAVESGQKTLDSSLEKGNYGEMKTDEKMRQAGYERISNDIITSIEDPGHQGIDGVYYNPDGHPPYAIVDAKFGTAQLQDTQSGRQMSDGWIDSRLDSSVGKEKADDIRMEKLKNPDNVGSYVSHVDESGRVSFDRLDGSANVIEKDVKING